MSSDHSVILKASGIRKAFYSPIKVEVLKDINLSVHPGDTVAIMGMSGQGKSTLLQILGTLESPCEGTLEIAGRSVNRFNCSAIRNQNLAFIFQSFQLLDDYTALENVLMPAKIARQNTAKGSVAYKRCVELLDQVGLSGRTHFDTKLLSGGEKQRVAIARALCNDPALILADEPSGNLDRQTSHQIHELLLGFAKRAGKALVVVTHDQELASLCDKQYTLREGVLHL
jgi:lipoprotein-releasing system ATP-binding protein